MPEEDAKPLEPPPKAGGYRVLIVGCGDIGSRHLQAVASLPQVQMIEVVDSRTEGLQLGRERLAEVPQCSPGTEFCWLSSLDQANRDGDLCIVATQAQGRCQLVREVAETLGYSSFILEKLAAQSVQEMEDLIQFSRAHGLSAWVNCKSRVYRFHQRAKQRLDPDDPIIFHVVGGNYGIATGGIHHASLFAFYDEAECIKGAGSRIDPVLHRSKRGDALFDLSGSLSGYTQKGSQFMLSYAGDHHNGEHISISTRRYRCIVDHLQRVAFESDEDSGWTWRESPFDGPILISEMTKEFASDILSSGSCKLPTLGESLVAHRFILGELQPHFSRLLGRPLELCPVT